MSKKQIIEILKQHVGQENAITVKTIHNMVSNRDDSGITNPITRAVIKEIIAEESLPIASCPRGYFVINTVDEFNEYIRNLQSRMGGIQDRINKVRIAYIRHRRGKGTGNHL